MIDTDSLEILGSLLKERYRIKEPIGSGAMSHVFLALDEVSGENVAIKLLRPNIASKNVEQRLFREFNACSQLNHPNVAKMLDCGRYGKTEAPYLAMEYLPYPCLEDVLKDVKIFSQQQVAHLLGQLASACLHCHELQVIHRDIKPANVIFSPDGRVVLIDFGIALAQDMTALTGTGEMLGTPLYLAPEVINGEQATAQSDIYSLGVLCYELLTGQRPYDGENLAEMIGKMMMAQYPQPTELQPHLAKGWDHFISKSLSEDLSLRFATMADFISSLNDLRQSFSNDAIIKQHPSEPHKEDLFAERYELIEEFAGSSPAALFYRAKDSLEGNYVYLKVISAKPFSDEQKRNQLKRRLNLCSSLAHPSLSPIVDSSVDGESIYYAANAVEGQELKALIEGEGSFDSRKAKRTLLALAKALQKCHSQGVVHGQINPNNILVKADGTPVLIDYGLLELLHSTRMTIACEMNCLSCYVAPEVLAGGRYGEASDIYSFGVLTYFLLTGERPFAGKGFASLFVQILGGHYKTRNLSQKWNRFIEACMQRDPDQRLVISDVIALLEGSRISKSHKRSKSKALSQPIPEATKEPIPLRAMVFAVSTILVTLLIAFFPLGESKQSVTVTLSREKVNALKEEISKMISRQSPNMLGRQLDEVVNELDGLRKQGHGVTSTLDEIKSTTAGGELKVDLIKAHWLNLSKHRQKEACELLLKTLASLRQRALKTNDATEAASHLALERQLAQRLSSFHLPKGSMEEERLVVESCLLASKLLANGLPWQEQDRHFRKVMKWFQQRAKGLSAKEMSFATQAITSVLDHKGNLFTYGRLRKQEMSSLFDKLEVQRIISFKNRDLSLSMWLEYANLHNSRLWATLLYLAQSETTLKRRRRSVNRLIDGYSVNDVQENYEAILGPLWRPPGLSRQSLALYVVAELIRLRYLATTAKAPAVRLESWIAYSREGRNFTKVSSYTDNVELAALKELNSFLQSEKEQHPEDDLLLGLLLLRENMIKKGEAKLLDALKATKKYLQENSTKGLPTNRQFARALAVYDGALAYTTRAKKVRALSTFMPTLRWTLDFLGKHWERVKHHNSARSLHAKTLAQCYLHATKRGNEEEKKDSLTRLQKIIRADKYARRSLKRFLKVHPLPFD